MPRTRATPEPTRGLDQDERAALLAGEDRFVRMTDLRRITRLSPSEIHRRLASGRFPQPHRIGPKTVVWRLSLVQRWMDQVYPPHVPEAPQQVFR